MGMHRRNVDDGARLACFQSLSDECSGYQPDRSYVNVLDPIEVRFVGLVRETAQTDSRTIDQACDMITVFGGGVKNFDDILRFTDIAWKGDRVIESGSRRFSSLDGQIVDEKQTAGFDHSFTYATAYSVAPTASHENRFSGQIQRRAPNLGECPE
jgi:hypothetical protein